MEDFGGGTYKLTVNNSTVESVTYTATIGSFTDTLNISWIAEGDPVPTTLTLESNYASRVVGNTLLITASVRDQFNAGLAGQLVYLENTGSSTPGISTLMNDDGNGVYTYLAANPIVEPVTYTATLGSFTDTLNISWIAEGGGVPCFLEGTRILCQVDDREAYLLIESLVPGTLVKTSLDGYKKLVLIGSGLIENPDNDNRLEQRLYKLSRSKYPELKEDLFITGCHSILVPELTEKERDYTERHLTRVFVTDKQYRLMACLDERAVPWNSKGTYTIWHFALENEDVKMNYGVYANGGLLVETCCLKRMRETSYMTFA
jgi:hypothetical protein